MPVILFKQASDPIKFKLKNFGFHNHLLFLVSKKFSSLNAVISMNSSIRVFFLIITMLCLNGDLQAQPRPVKQEPIKVTFYYNILWELTTAENSVYRREAYFDLVDMLFDGVYNDYNRGNKLIADGIYSHGVKTGIHTEYADHTVKTKIEYSGNDFTIWEWNNGKSEGVKNGTGKFSMFYFYFVTSDGQVVPKEGMIDGEVQNGRRVGRWTYHDLNKFKTDEETYSNGKPLKRMRHSKRDSIELKEKKPIYLSLYSLNTEMLMFDKASFANLNQYFEKYIAYPASFERNATYPRGLKLLLTMLSQAMDVPKRNIELLRLRIDEHGQVTKATIVRSISSVYDNLTDEIFGMHQNRVLPAMKNGKPLASVVYIPIASGDQWTRMLEEMPTEWFLDPSNFD